MTILSFRAARPGLTVVATALALVFAPTPDGVSTMRWPSGAVFSSAALAGPGHGHDHAEPGKAAAAVKSDKATPVASSEGHDHNEADEGLVRMTEAQIAENRIGVAVAGPGVLTQTLTAPGIIAPDSDRIARIAARVVGTVAVLNRRLGDVVEKGEIVAELDSREVAEARSEHFAALSNLELQKTLFSREEALWSRRVSAEQQFLRARNTLREVELRVELAVQKLAALGLSAGDAAAPRDGVSPGEALQRYPLRSPIRGRVLERRVDPGAPVGGDGQEKEIYVIADLSKVWADLSVPADELSQIHEGQAVRILMKDGAPAQGRIIFVSPVLGAETRAARVIAGFDNDPLRLRPGGHVTARIITGEVPVALRIPRDALQTVNSRPAVFVRTTDGFRLRPVSTGKDDGVDVAVTSGLSAGDVVASGNSFLLKAELGKAEAEHVH